MWAQGWKKGRAKGGWAGSVIGSGAAAVGVVIGRKMWRRRRRKTRGWGMDADGTPDDACAVFAGKKDGHAGMADTARSWWELAYGTKSGSSGGRVAAVAGIARGGLGGWMCGCTSRMGGTGGGSG
jgi:hypothetical protein